MRFVFVMDPIETVLVDADTSFAIMEAAETRGHRVDHCLLSDVALDEGRVVATVRSATMQRVPERPILLGEPERIRLDDVDAVFVRKDPPFDDAYLWLTLLLEHLRGRTLVVNDPEGLRNANEKLYACHFPAVMPKTIVESDKARIKVFAGACGGHAVIKPIDGHGGEGVFQLRTDDKNVNAIIESVTRGGARCAMVQEFIPAVAEGDKRILLLDGEPLGAILRVPRHDDVRSNIHVGGTVIHADLTPDDRRIIEAVRDRLRKDGLWFVGLDVIGGKLTEVNVTSPTGIQQMIRLTGQPLAERVIEALERKVEAFAQ